MKTKSALLFILAASIMTAPVPTCPGALAVTSQEATPAESVPARLIVEDFSKPAGSGPNWLEKWLPPIFFEAHFLGLVLWQWLGLILLALVPWICLLYTSDAADDRPRV